SWRLGGLVTRQLGPGPCSANLRGDSALEGLEVVCEETRELRGLRVVRRGVGPCAPGLQDARRDVRTTRRDVEVEPLVAFVGDAVERSRERGADHRPRVCDLHPLTGAIAATRPPRIDEPHARLMFGDALAEHRGV